MERRAQLRPGYDCRRECQHAVKGAHGIASDEWWFAVVSGRFALSLVVLSGNYPGTVSMEGMLPFLKEPRASAWAVHRADASGGACEYVEGGRCQTDVIFFFAESFWLQRGVPSLGLEQPESFWEALESALRKEIGS